MEVFGSVIIAKNVEKAPNLSFTPSLFVHQYIHLEHDLWSFYRFSRPLGGASHPDPHPSLFVDEKYCMHCGQIVPNDQAPTPQNVTPCIRVNSRH